MIFQEQKRAGQATDYEQSPILLSDVSNPGNPNGKKSERHASRAIEEQSNSFKKWCKKHLNPANLLTLAIALAAWEQFHATQGQLSVMKDQLDEMRRGGQASTEQIWRAVDNMNWLARTMQGSLKESQIARDTSEKRSKAALDASIQSSRTDQRAWIAVSSPKMAKEPEIQTDYSIVLDITNVGKTPAATITIKSSSGFIHFKDQHPPPVNWSAMRNTAPTAIQFPATTTRDLRIPFPNITSSVLNAYRTRETKLFACYRFDYVDIFGSQHFTEECFSHEFGSDMSAGWSVIRSDVR